MNKTDVSTMRALNIEMVEKLANEVSARMSRFHRIHVLMNVQFSLMVPGLARHINFQNNIC